jgi:hypothetical protein
MSYFAAVARTSVPASSVVGNCQAQTIKEPSGLSNCALNRKLEAAAWISEAVGIEPYQSSKPKAALVFENHDVPAQLPKISSSQFQQVKPST